MSRVNDRLVPDDVAKPQDTPAPAQAVRIDEGRRRSLRRWAWAGVGALTLTLVAVGSTSTPLFHAKTIDVQGEHHLSERGVLRVAGIDPGTNVFSLNEAAVARRLERDPWVARATVTTRLPSTIEISLTERRPIAVVPMGTGERAQMVAADGTVLGAAPAGVRLPELLGPAAVPGEPAITLPPSAVVSAAATADSLGESLRPVVEAIVVQADRTLILQLRSGVTVTYGPASELEEKAQALRAILTWALERGGGALDSIDVSAPAAPTAVQAGSLPIPVPADIVGPR
jgi:cell division protein FtsQ